MKTPMTDSNASTDVRFDVIVDIHQPQMITMIDRAAQSAVRVAPNRGGLITSFTVGNEPVLYLDEETLTDLRKNVRGGIPLLFPIAGKLVHDRTELNGASFVMKQHGFARNLPWQVTHTDTRTDATLVMELSSSVLTKPYYPFEFRAQVAITLQGNTLRLEWKVYNLENISIPIQPGMHPYFYVKDSDKCLTMVRSDATLALNNRTGEKISVQVPFDFTVDELDLHLINHTLRDILITRPSLKAIRMKLDEEQNVLVLWTQKNRDFLCVEPWSRPANAFNDGKAVMIAPHGFWNSSVELIVE